MVLSERELDIMKTTRREKKCKAARVFIYIFLVDAERTDVYEKYPIRGWAASG
jgi:hypothetical protein